MPYYDKKDYKAKGEQKGSKWGRCTTPPPPVWFSIPSDVLDRYRKGGSGYQKSGYGAACRSPERKPKGPSYDRASWSPVRIDVPRSDWRDRYSCSVGVPGKAKTRVSSSVLDHPKLCRESVEEDTSSCADDGFVKVRAVVPESGPVRMVGASCLEDNVQLPESKAPVQRSSKRRKTVASGPAVGTKGVGKIKNGDEQVDT